LALAVASKLLPLMFFPFLIRRLGWRRSLTYFSWVGLTLVLLWLPLLSSTLLANFSNSIELYFQRFEFNASLFYLIKWIGYQYEGYNLIRWIGPALALVVFLLILLQSLRDRGQDWAQLPTLWLFAMSVYLCCATTVHPWYTALPLVFCVFTPYRWPVLWSYLITFTYITYWTPGLYQENLWVVALEYVVLMGYGWMEYKGMLSKRIEGKF
jgi:hypothetical protein